jgi:hypothetical protein
MAVVAGREEEESVVLVDKLNKIRLAARNSSDHRLRQIGWKRRQGCETTAPTVRIDSAKRRCHEKPKVHESRRKHFASSWGQTSGGCVFVLQRQRLHREATPGTLAVRRRKKGRGAESGGFIAARPDAATLGWAGLPHVLGV